MKVLALTEAPNHVCYRYRIEAFAGALKGLGWTLESLGAWRPHQQAPTSTGSNSYATGYAAFVLREAGVARSQPRMAEALAWLRSHQDRESGSWAADSMNKVYEPDSIPLRFMRDAATAFASLALLEAR